MVGAVMIKFFCDWCGIETDKYYGWADNPLIVHLRSDKKFLRAEVTISMGGSYNSAHICKSCALKLIRQGVE